MSWSKLGEFVAREEGFGQRPLGETSYFFKIRDWIFS